MYNDYPAIYETVLDRTLIYFLILGVISLIIIIVSLISMIKIYKKANRSGLSAIIPIYNTIVLFEIVNLPQWYIIFMFIPVLNVIIYIKAMLLLAKLFKKSKAFGIGLILLPFIFYPILAFDGSEYIGINLVAMQGKSEITNLPQMPQEEDKNPVIHESVDENSSQLNISIGGGVYQKNYTQDLLNVDAKQAIYNDKSNINNKNTMKSDPTNFSFITTVPIKETKIEEPKKVTIDFPDRLNNSQVVNHEMDSIKVNEIVTNPKIEETAINSNNNLTQSIPDNTNTINGQVVNNSNVQNNQAFSICPKCGTRLSKNAKICFLCGNHLE